MMEQSTKDYILAQLPNYIGFNHADEIEHVTETLEEDRLELVRLKSMTQAEKIEYGKKVQKDDLESYSKFFNERTLESNKLGKTLEDLRAWNITEEFRSVSVSITQGIARQKFDSDNMANYYLDQIKKVSDQKPLENYERALTNLIYTVEDNESRLIELNEAMSWQSTVKQEILSSLDLPSDTVISFSNR